MKRLVLAVLTMFVSTANAFGVVLPDSGKVYLGGEVFAGKTVSFDIDGFKAIINTPSGTVTVWELPDPAEPAPEVAQKYIGRDAVLWQLQVAVSNSYAAGRQAEHEAIQSVVTRFPTVLDRVDQEFWEAKLLDTYLIYWHGDDPESPVQWSPFRGHCHDSDKSWRATPESIHRQLQHYINASVDLLNEGCLVIILPGERLERPTNLVFDSHEEQGVLGEVSALKEGREVELRFIPPALAPRFRQ